MKAETVPVPSLTPLAQRIVKTQIEQLARDAPRRRTEEHSFRAHGSDLAGLRARIADPTRSLQEIYAPAGRCFGCGPNNDNGLRIRSFAHGLAPGSHVMCDFTPTANHHRGSELLHGKIIGTLLDCHSNWTAIFHLMRTKGLQQAPSCVAVELKVVLRRPTLIGPTHVDAHVVGSSGDRVRVEATMSARGKVTAHVDGTFMVRL